MSKVGISALLKLSAGADREVSRSANVTHGLGSLLNGRHLDEYGLAWRSKVAETLRVEVDSQLIKDAEIVVSRWRWQRSASSPLAAHAIRRELDVAAAHLRAARAALRRANGADAPGDDLDTPVWPRRRDGGAVAEALKLLDELVASGAGLEIRSTRNPDDGDLVRLLADIWCRAGKCWPASFDRRRPFGRFVDDATGEDSVSREAANRALVGP